MAATRVRCLWSRRSRRRLSQRRWSSATTPPAQVSPSLARRLESRDATDRECSRETTFCHFLLGSKAPLTASLCSLSPSLLSTHPSCLSRSLDADVATPAAAFVAAAAAAAVALERRVTRRAPLESQTRSVVSIHAFAAADRNLSRRSNFNSHEHACQDEGRGKQQDFLRHQKSERQPASRAPAAAAVASAYDFNSSLFHFACLPPPLFSCLSSCHSSCLLCFSDQKAGFGCWRTHLAH